ncbi:MAG: uroporphyrinogen-III decarboxylase-like protein, partial [Candidatus Omnitrophica bacterium]|nr:uroporphyrinogen-III decarboxylase-like protein [Candidatus Omnitrophota bacterium]
DWYEDNLPDDMCVLIGNKNVGHFCQLLMGLFGYENLCYQLYDNRALVKAVSQKLAEINEKMMKIFMSFRRVKMIFVADDMGFRSGTLISPDDLREFVIPAHKTIAEIAHAHNIPYLLHSCGDIEVVIDDLINDVKIDGKHSFEDNIILISEAQKQYGDKIALLGGIDMDFLCRADEKTIRQRVRKTIELFNGTGGFCLGTGNSVANYIPLDNYLIMLDEGRNFV